MGVDPAELAEKISRCQATISDIHNKWEEEALALFRDIEYGGDPQLALRLLKTLDDDFYEMQNEERVIPDE